MQKKDYIKQSEKLHNAANDKILKQLKAKPDSFRFFKRRSDDEKVVITVCFAQ